MKKRVYLISIGLFVLLFITAGCSNNAATVEENGKLSVVSTTTIIADVVSQVVGDHVKTNVILPFGSDPHRFDPSPTEARMIADADILFINGVGLDSFLLDLVPPGEDAPIVIDLSDGLPLIGIHGADDDHDHDSEMDPHVWLDPGNLVLWTENIVANMQQLDPTNSEDYSNNGANYQAKLGSLDEWIHSEIDEIPPEDRLLVTDHDSLGYFAQKYGFEIVGFVVPGYSTLAQPSAQDLAALIDTIKATGVPVIFVDPSFNPALADAVGQDAAVDVVPLYTGSLSSADGPAATYIEMMTSNVLAIRESLTGK